MRWRVLAFLAGALSLAACASPRPGGLPGDAAAYAVIPPAPAVSPPPEVRLLRSGDEVAVSVYREPDLSVPKVAIDEVGMIQLPLLGQVEAAGRSPVALGQHVAALLGQRYLKRPQVSVSVLTAVPRTVTVEGQVRSPGSYPLTRGDTLLTSLARAGSPNEYAKLNEVVVFRTVAGQRMGAVFDVRRIRVGQAPDPQIVDGDLVVVGYSQVRGAFRDFLSASPLLNLFTVF